MKLFKSILVTLLLLAPLAALAQGGIEIDYTHPKKYVIGGMKVDGNSYFSDQQIIQQTGLRAGMSVNIPGDEISSIVNRLWQQRYFEDVAVSLDSLSASKDTAWLKIAIVERPRVSRWTYTGVKSSEKKDIQERLNLRPGREFSEYVKTTSVDIIKRYYKEKGFLLCDVDVQVQKDSVIRSAIRVNFDVKKGEKVRIKTINFIGRDEIKAFKLAKSMKKTKAGDKIYNIFASKKFNEKEYVTDKKSAVEVFNEAGYRDARLIRDSIYYVKPNRLGIDLEFDKGEKYYFRNITWTGNSVYATETLNEILKIEPGDVYDVVTMNKRLFGGGKQTDYDISKLYRDNGYLFFNVTPV